MKPLTMGVGAFCEALDIGRTTAFKLIREREVDSILLGRKRLVIVASAEALVAKRQDEPREGAALIESPAARVKGQR